MTCDTVTTQFLTGKEKSSANDKPCWAAMSLMSIAVTQQARNALALMEEATPDLKLVMETLLNPVLWRQEILKQSKLIQDWLCFLLRTVIGVHFAVYLTTIVLADTCGCVHN